VLAQDEARLRNHDDLGTEHLLLGLIGEGEGVAVRALESLGVSLEAVRARAETWVHDHARPILAGRASIVAAAIRRKATRNHLDPAKRKPAATAAAYLLNKQPYLDYPTALASGWPIATGVIEGACRHLSRTAWTAPAPAGASQAWRRSSKSGRSTATATSTPTGPTTWPKNSNGSTPTTTPTRSSPPADHP
jgi:Clp amino terminal domain, pathogenicity island component